MCTLTEENDLKFERVALNAFAITRLAQEEKQSVGFKPLSKTIEMMCDLVSTMEKENLPKLRPHVERLMFHFDDSNTPEEQKQSLVRLYAALLGVEKP